MYVKTTEKIILSSYQAVLKVKRPTLMEQIEVFHSEIPDAKQEEIASSLLTEDGKIKIVIATSALSMGFDAIGTFIPLKLFTVSVRNFAVVDRNVNIQNRIEQ